MLTDIKITRAGYSRKKDATDNRNICAIFVLMDTSIALFINSYFFAEYQRRILNENTFLLYAASFFRNEDYNKLKVA